MVCPYFGHVHVLPCSPKLAVGPCPCEALALSLVQNHLSLRSAYLVLGQASALPFGPWPIKAKELPSSPPPGFDSYPLDELRRSRMRIFQLEGSNVAVREFLRTSSCHLIAYPHLEHPI